MRSSKRRLRDAPAVGRAGRESSTRPRRSAIELLEPRFVLSASSVVGRFLFYNNSGFDGQNPGVDSLDNAAIATDKHALPSGAGAATFGNISTYASGINGLMIDITGSHPAITANDFTLRVGDDNSPGAWSSAPAPTVVVRPGAGTSGSDRVELVWADGAISDTFLQVIVAANVRTGLATSDTFFFGSKIDDSGQGNTAGFFTTDVVDFLQARSNPISDAPPDSPFDYNRDATVDVTDFLMARAHPGEIESISAAAVSPPSITAALSHDTGPGGGTNNDGITTDATVGGTLTGANSITSFKVSLNSGQTFEELSQVQPNGSFTLGASVLQQLYGGPPPDGAYVMHLQGVDSQGLTCFVDVPFTLKRFTVPPDQPDLLAVSDSGSSNTDNITNINTPTIAVTAESGSLVSLYVDSVVVAQQTASPTAQFILSPLSNATHIIQAKAEDGAGNSAGFSTSLSVRVSNVLPSVTATTLVTVSSDLTPHLTVTASDPLTLADFTQVNVDVDVNNDGDFADSGESNRTQSSLFGGQSYFQVTPALPATPVSGPYYVQMRARVTDVAGNEGISTRTSLLIDDRNNDVLKNYVNAADPSYGYIYNRTNTGSGVSAYVLDLTSQTWRSAADFSPPTQPPPNPLPQWHHWLQVIVPPGAINSTALMYIHGGSNTSSAPTTVDATLASYATLFHSVIVDLPMVPNEKIRFSDETFDRNEDAIIAYTFNKYVNHLGDTGNETWPLLLPMVKSAVKAMTATQSFVPTVVGGGHVDDFVLTGYSKRGWTTWLTGAVDSRVKAIIPGVFDNLNVGEQMVNHYGYYGFFAPTLNDYTAFNLPQNSYTTTGLALGPVIDPYRYFGKGDTRFDNMPKLILNSAGDEYFVPSSSSLYINDLPGTKNYMRYIPNTGHGLNSVDPVVSTKSFYDAVINNRALPQFSWTVQQDNSIRVQTTTAPTSVVMWKATNPNARDFRNSVAGIPYVSTTLTDQGGGVYVASAPVPSSGATAFFIELTYPSSVSGAPYIFPTEVKVLSPLPAVTWPFFMPTNPPPPSGSAAAGADDNAVASGLAAPATTSDSQTTKQQLRVPSVVQLPSSPPAAVVSPDLTWTEPKEPVASLDEDAVDSALASLDEENLLEPTPA